MKLNRLLTNWRHTPQIAENIPAWKTIPARHANPAPLPEDLHPALKAFLHAQGIETLYSHQLQTWDAIRAGHNPVIATGTASGKTLCYTRPVVDRLLRAPAARALYLFPTKALAHDQLAGLQKLLETAPFASTPSLSMAAYDGDTPANKRPAIRENARLVISNPDMLHAGILPFHPRWADFFRNLALVVIDEVHTYRGVFGSHVANVIRRLKRIVAFYGARPQFIMTSATIANPVDLCERLIEAPVKPIVEDGSARGPKHFLIYNPPVVNPDLGIRRSVMQESVFLAGDLLAYDLQSVLFARSRRAVELTLTNLREQSQPIPRGQPDAGEPIRSYRSGYLPKERREIERGLREGDVRLVVATNALELGIDIGGMDAVLLAGYPGTIAGTWQQAGRAGRGEKDSLAVLLVSANPLDQYLSQHPDYFFGRSPEKALINPDNLLILLSHLRCAAFELPFQTGDTFGTVDSQTVEAILAILEQNHEVHRSGKKYFWVSDQYPSRAISLRTASANRVLLQNEIEGRRVTVGEVDEESAPWMVHPGAIYLHAAQSYRVDELDLDQGIARLRPVQTDYYTEPLIDTEINLIDKHRENQCPGGWKVYGDIRVTNQVAGFRKVQWGTNERLSQETLDLSPSDLLTTGYWLALSEETVEKLRSRGLWGADPNDYSPEWRRLRETVRARDRYRCQNCGKPESGRAHDVHHIIPFKAFANFQQANQFSNLITLCPACHRQAEAVVRIRSSLAGLGFLLGHLAPLFLMCDHNDLGVHTDPQSPLAEGLPAIVIFERVPAGIGFSEELFELHGELMQRASEVVANCPCSDGCPSCVGPGGEAGQGGKEETRQLLELLLGKTGWVAPHLIVVGP